MGQNISQPPNFAHQMEANAAREAHASMTSNAAPMEKQITARQEQWTAVMTQAIAMLLDIAAYRLQYRCKTTKM